jgi:transcriptional regulator with XRE-family HTH domain
MAGRDGNGFGAALKGYREVGRISQSKLAERAGFDHSYVSRLESGARTPTREAVLQIAGALDLDPAGQDALLAAAGFLPREVSSLLAEEPEITLVLGLLQDQAVPEAFRENIRQQLRLLAEQARFSLRPRGYSGAAA